MKRLVIFALASGLVWAISGTAYGKIIPVPSPAYPTIQAGIIAASPGDTVQVAPGTYYENITMTSGVVIQGAGQSVSIIDGGATGSVVTAIGVDSAAMLDGFTITNGEEVNGGGMYNEGSSPTVSNCTFTGNSAFLLVGVGDGGGMYNWNSSPTVTNCTFSGNEATGDGGGMYNVNSSPTVTNCTFSDNTAERGGGMYNGGSSPTVTNCVFSDNTSANWTWGGGMVNEDSSPTVSRCSFFNNHAGTVGGGLVNSSASSPIVASCVFYNNTANDQFGRDMANYTSSASPAVVNCTFWNGGHYSMYNVNCSPTVTNCIFWGAGFDMIWNFGTASPVVTYSDIEQGNVIYPGAGNINADPMFVDAASGDLHLQPFSPCIDAGLNSAQGIIGVDFEGDPRIIDGDDDGTATVDIGADEYVLYSAIILTAPNGGEAIPSGSTYSIRWGAPLDAVRFKLKYSMDNGTTWKPIPSEIAETTYEWDVPIPKKNKKKCLVKVIGYDDSDTKVGADKSDSTFTIEVVKVTYPNGGVLTSGDQHTITWTTNETKNPVEKVILKYTKNGGGTWKKITAIEGSNPGTCPWTVPDVPKTKSKCLVKVVLKDVNGKTVGSDTSDGYFTIEPTP